MQIIKESISTFDHTFKPLANAPSFFNDNVLNFGPANSGAFLLGLRRARPTRRDALQRVP